MRKPIEHWPQPIPNTNTFYEGFNDQYLEHLVSKDLLRNDEKHLRTPPWLFWTTELYSFGRCYREWLNWPRRLPIPAYGDHGINLRREAAQHELDNLARLHLTWSYHRRKLFDDSRKKKVLRIPHPWITHRRSQGIRQSAEPKGTIVFHAHSNAGIEIEDYDFAGYFRQLRGLPSEYQPVVICLHMHDINKGYHEKLRKYGFPIVTAGNTSSPFFVDRFYEIIREFRFASSNRPNSDLFYCEELGLRYFVLGEEPLLINRSHAGLPLGPHVPCEPTHIERREYMFRLFRELPPPKTPSKDAFVEEILGLDVNTRVALRKTRRAFLVEMVRLSPMYFWKVLRRTTKQIRGKRLSQIVAKIPAIPSRGNK